MLAHEMPSEHGAHVLLPPGWPIFSSYKTEAQNNPTVMQWWNQAQKVFLKSTHESYKGNNTNNCLHCLHFKNWNVLPQNGFVFPYGSDSAGRGKCLFYVLFSKKVEPPCDQTWLFRIDCSIDNDQIWVLHPGKIIGRPWNFFFGTLLWSSFYHTCQFLS